MIGPVMGKYSLRPCERRESDQGTHRRRHGERTEPTCEKVAARATA